ncbi:MAG: energy-coupling factor transporter transmembrane component T, partial [Pseudomonadota bacterium]
VHTTPPLHKVLLLFVSCTSLFVWENWIVLGASACAVSLLFIVAKIPLEHMKSALKPALLLLFMIFILQVYLNSLETAAFGVLRFVVMILAASLLTLTTKTSDLISSVETGLGRFISPKASEAISLAFSLCFRFIPMVRQIFEEVREAQRARGHSGNWRALITPTIVRTLKSADEVSQAIAARSIDTSHLSNPKNDAMN